MAIVYAGVAFIIFQIVDATFEPLHLPDWLSTAVVVLLALGFPIAVGLAWAFDLTAEGLVRAKVKREPTVAKAPHHVIIGNKTLAIIAAVAVAVAVWSWLGRSSAGGAAISSIAVLPLDNLGGDPEQVYFVDGMHEAIITNLNRLSALKVISRTSAMRYKDTDKLMPEIARELGVDALVEGSVLKAGNRVRITAQLIHGASDEHLWSNDYEGDLTDILSLQKTVARAIAGEIGLALKPEEEAYLASAPQVNPEAYNLYLKGWHFRNLETTETIPKAVEYLEQAVALDSTFARAWAALGNTYFLMSGVVGTWKWDYAINRTKRASDKALELDPNLSEAYTGLGAFHISNGDISAAEASFRRALELEPNNVHALYEYGLFLYRQTGRPDEALVKMQRALELDPLNPLPLAGFGWVYTYTREYDKALEYWQAVLDLSPDNVPAHLFQDLVNLEILLQQGRYEEAAAGMAKAYAAGSNVLKRWLYFPHMRAEWALGNKEKVYAERDSLRAIGELQQDEQEYPLWWARFYGIIGEKEKALGLLERAYEDTAMDMPTLVYFQGFDFLRAEPRFKALLQKLGLTEVFDQNGQLIRPLDESLEAYNVPD